MPMSPDEIKHFLISFDPTTGDTKVQSFDTDYDAAQSAYSKAEQESGMESNLDIVLISADSLETIKQTHSSYFSGGSVQLQELLPG
jgi:adenosine deaminase